jgi:CUB domain
VYGGSSLFVYFGVMWKTRFISYFVDNASLLAQLACVIASRPVHVACDSGMITSQNYPGNYPNDANCEWLLMTSIPNGVSATS